MFRGGCCVATLVAWEGHILVLGPFVVIKGRSIFCKMITLITRIMMTDIWYSVFQCVRVFLLWNHIDHNYILCFGDWTSCGNKGQKYFSSNYHIHHTIDRYCCASIFCGHEVSQRLLLWNYIDHNYTHYFGDWIYCGIKGQWYLLPNNRIQCRGGKRCCAFSKWLLSCQKRSVLKCHTVHMSILLPHA